MPLRSIGDRELKPLGAAGDLEGGLCDVYYLRTRTDFRHGITPFLQNASSKGRSWSVFGSSGCSGWSHRRGEDHALVTASGAKAQSISRRARLAPRLAPLASSPTASPMEPLTLPKVNIQGHQEHQEGEGVEGLCSAATALSVGAEAQLLAGEGAGR